jgi:DNA invertase Pin-like site-specific DNA recombinase
MPIPAAQYLRMSTEHQQYSLENQSAAIKCYASEHGFEIVKNYADIAKSGLLLRNRAGLRAMLEDVVSGQSKFKAILVLDVSRWGRFQDIDESAHYEFLCKQAGAPVHYCSENFSNESTLANMIVKTLKRSMAAEYSRELSSKVVAGTRRIASLGFRNGGVPGYGFRRLLVTADRTPKELLDTGQRKSISTDRVILVPGPQHEVQTVREIYGLFVGKRLSTAAIAEELNCRGIRYLKGRSWYQVGVYRVLTHPKYCGCHVFGQRSQILKGPNISMPKSTWCVVSNAFEPIVKREIFEEAQRIIHSKTFFKTNDRVLDALRALWAEKGRLSQKLISKSKDVPSTQTFWSRFGGLRNAYRLIGYSGIQSSPDITATRKKLAVIKRGLLGEIVKMFPGEVCLAQKNWRQRLRLKLRDNSLITVYLCRSHRFSDGSLRWLLDTSRSEICRLSLIARMNEDNSGFFDFHILPCIRTATRLTLKCDDCRLLTGVRFTEVSQFLSAARRLNVVGGSRGTA